VRGGDRSIVLQKTGFINEAGHCEVFAYLERLRAMDAFRRALIAESAPNRQDGGQA
jgi:hypothetical protein